MKYLGFKRIILLIQFALVPWLAEANQIGLLCELLYRDSNREISLNNGNLEPIIFDNHFYNFTPRLKFQLPINSMKESEITIYGIKKLFLDEVDINLDEAQATLISLMIFENRHYKSTTNLSLVLVDGRGIDITNDISLTREIKVKAGHFLNIGADSNGHVFFTVNRMSNGNQIIYYYPLSVLRSFSFDIETTKHQSTTNIDFSSNNPNSNPPFRSDATLIDENTFVTQTGNYPLQIKTVPFQIDEKTGNLGFYIPNQ